MPTTSFSGVFAAVPTPLSLDGSTVDRLGIDRVTRHIIDGNAHGLVVGGSTGEFTALSLDERKFSTEAFVAAAGGRVPVIAGTGALTTAETIELSAHAAKAGATSVMVAPPYYERPSFEELVAHLRAVVEAVDVPVMYYHMPALTGVELSGDQLVDLVRRTGVTSVKDSGGDFTAFTHLHQHPEVSAALNGWDSLTMSAFAAGSPASVWGLASVLPRQSADLYDAVVVRGDLARGRAIWAGLFPICEFLDTVNYVAAIKAGLELVGVEAGPPRRPVQPLDPANRARFAELLRAAGATVGAGATRTSTPNIPAAVGGQDVRRGGRSLLEPRLLPAHGHFIDGRSSDGTSARTIDVVDPCTETSFTSVVEGSAADVNRAVAAARRAQGEWAAKVPKERSEILHRIADRIEEHGEDLAVLESVNTGKPLMVSRDDIAGTVDTFRYMAGALRGFTTQGAGNYVEDHLSVILREPLGVVGVVTPWNYPLMMAAWKIAPILAAGNSLVIKPSEQTPLTTLRFAELTADLLPAGVVNVVTGYGPEVGGRLSDHPDIAMIALTGSVNSGRAVARGAAESLKRVHLELGGKAPVILFEDANLAEAAESLRAAGYWNSGQECGAGCRVLVHESVAEAFVEHLVREVGTLVVGEPGAGEDVEIGPLVSKAHYDRVTGYLQRAAQQGIRSAIGGAPSAGAGYFVPPTVLVDVPEGAEVAREEIFGPVVTVETFRDEEEVVRRANSTQYGLAASVWTENARRSHAVAGKLDFGTVWVNSHLVLSNEVPWGGFKGSGYGRDLSIYALDDYSRTKHVMHNHGR
ncbi:aldehyde dehydrogenase family protein [Saccharopolyspora erythraea]|uniref:aldehyde dehydrogenase family protein n=1 Tax=Saccharopolyspora erythraea TaxID=1836 RepID=UPI001BAB8B5B|nr:aldehyde dehydrogenase family protein [Saccharopolyspora erythraea]